MDTYDFYLFPISKLEVDAPLALDTALLAFGEDAQFLHIPVDVIDYDPHRLMDAVKGTQLEAIEQGSTTFSHWELTLFTDEAAPALEQIFTSWKEKFMCCLDEEIILGPEEDDCYLSKQALLAEIERGLQFVQLLKTGQYAMWSTGV